MLQAREVIYRRAQEFKIEALRGLKGLFPGKFPAKIIGHVAGSPLLTRELLVSFYPFYAGFGNRPSDVVSYGATGVPKGKIFIIDPKGVVSNASSKVLQQVGATLTMVSVSATDFTVMR
jgi:phosphatidate phosphatase LPIN